MSVFWITCHTNLGAIIGFGFQILHFGDLFEEVGLLHAGLGPATLELSSGVRQNHLQVHCETYRKESDTGF